ncbi:endonuclease/exonuclease/phosphatase family protein [Streptomyces sp. NPDC058287]|uniref:endonuclease/exonuclease/phosphatase family protein n=1 Tax=Streptomyces sp. NPDC058287 TaxID=3346423 RepID=UPI0036E31114
MALLGTLLALPGEKSGLASRRPTVRVLQYNLCGAARACPWNAGGSGRGTSVARLVQAAAQFEPDIVTVNEICLPQYDALKSQLARAGWRMDGTYASSQDNVPACGRTGRFGEAVLSRGDVPDGRQDYRRFTHTGGETYTNGGSTVPVHRGLLCAHTRVRGKRVVACTAHTYSKAPEQLREIRDWTDGFSRNVPVVLAGDLNLPPDAPSLSVLTARFTEADRADDASTADGRKIDYLFAGRSHVRSCGADVVKYRESDHALLKGWFRFAS